jgi:hypothetical protein
MSAKTLTGGEFWGCEMEFTDALLMTLESVLAGQEDKGGTPNQHVFGQIDDGEHGQLQP